MKWNEVMDMLILEAHAVYGDVALTASVLKACPSCRVKRANVIAELDGIAGTMMDAMTRLRALKTEGGTEDE